MRAYYANACDIMQQALAKSVATAQSIFVQDHYECQHASEPVEIGNICRATFKRYKVKWKTSSNVKMNFNTKD